MQLDRHIVQMLWFRIVLFFYIINDKQVVSLGVSSRRTVLETAASAALGSFLPKPVIAADIIDSNRSLENRDRNNNKDAVIREDYWYLTGRLPPRKLEVSLNIDDPQWNAFGSCETTASTPTTGTTAGSSDVLASNSCTYVSLKQRIPAYSKYAFAISDGAKEYQKLGNLLQLASSSPEPEPLWDEAASYVKKNDRTIPPAIIDAELKMVLFATAMLTSPNFPTPGRELLVARFYVNEIHYASTQIASAIRTRDIDRALEAWKFGRDSWNSYFQVVNKSVTSKVGDKFQKIS